MDLSLPVLCTLLRIPLTKRDKGGSFREKRNDEETISSKQEDKAEIFVVIMSKEDLEKLILTRFIAGKRSRGKQTVTYLTSLSKGMKEKVY